MRCLPDSLGLAVILGKQVYEKLAVLALEFDIEKKLARFRVQVVQENNGVVPPVVTHGEHGRVARPLDTAKSPQPISGTSLRMRMIRSVQLSIESGWRRCIGGVDVLVTVRSLSNHRHDAACRFW